MWTEQFSLTMSCTLTPSVNRLVTLQWHGILYNWRIFVSKHCPYIMKLHLYTIWGSVPVLYLDTVHVCIVMFQFHCFTTHGSMTE